MTVTQAGAHASRAGRSMWAKLSMSVDRPQLIDNLSAQSVLELVSDEKWNCWWANAPEIAAFAAATPPIISR
jgi:hypothetical protein